MIEAFKLVHNYYYNQQAAVKMNFNTSSNTRGNMYKLQKFACHYNLRKFEFCVRTVNVWNSLPNEVVESNTTNTFKNRLDKHWSNQEVLFDFNADRTGTAWRSTSLYINILLLRCGHRGLPASVGTHWIGLDWIGISGEK